MPVSHIGLTVSHLPSSTSFFLSALQPLGYRFIGESGDQIGLGINDADFFLCQETPGVKAGAAHIAFTAPSTTAVRNFYTAALTAGGRPNGAPATRCEEDGHFNAAILDFDGNSIEVVYRNGPDIQNDGTVVEHSRVITWRRSVSESYRDDRSVASRPALTETFSKAASLYQAHRAPSVISKTSSTTRSVSEPIVVQQTTPAPDAGDGAAKKIIGTLLGAAAGAAVAYAMVQSEKDSAKKENDFSALMHAKATIKVAADFISQAASQPIQPMQDQQPGPEAATVPSQARSVHIQHQIEPAPSSYYTASPGSKPPTQVGETQTIEYAPAYSIAPSQTRSRYTSQRSVTNPEVLTIEKARSVVSTSKHYADARSVAPGSLISSFVPDVKRRSSEGSVLSHRSSRSKAKSSHDNASESSSHSKSRKEEVDDSSSPPAPASRAPSKAPSKAGSIVGSILGRYNKSTASNHGDFTEEPEIEELTEDDFETVVPSDSVSNAGSSSRRSHRSHRSKKHHDGSGSTVSKHSSASKHSSHSRRSHRSHKSRSHSDDSSAESEKRKHRSRPSVISEASEVSTVKPIKESSKARSRKDSVTRGQYDGLFDEVQSGFGRDVTPSMVSAAGKNQHRGMVNYNMAQRVRAFET